MISLAAAFQALPGASFIVNGVTFIGKLDGELASRAQTYTGTGTSRSARNNIAMP